MNALDGQHYVTSVNPGSPAEHAGIRVYDKIIQINSISTDSLQNHQGIYSNKTLNATVISKMAKIDIKF